MTPEPIQCLQEALGNPAHRRRSFVLCMYWLVLFAPPSALLVAATSTASLFFAGVLFLALTLIVGLLILRMQVDVVQEELGLESTALGASNVVQLVGGALVLYVLLGVALGIFWGVSAVFFNMYAELLSESYLSGNAEGATSIVVGVASLITNACAFGYLGYALRAIAAGELGWTGRAMTYGFSRVADPIGPEMVWIAYVYVVLGAIYVTCFSLASLVMAPIASAFFTFGFAVVNTVALPLYYARIPAEKLGLMNLDDDDDLDPADEVGGPAPELSREAKAALAAKLVAKAGGKSTGT